MWWPVVFWVLLLPLIVVEIVVFMRTKRLSWLIYALAIFAYVIAVSYTLDVFDAGRNVVILTLLASAALMAGIGRTLARPLPKRAATRRSDILLTILLGTILVALFTISVLCGTLSETVTPVEGIARDAIVARSDEAIKPANAQSIALVTRTFENAFFLPVPIARDAQFRACLETNEGMYELYSNEYYEEYPEVGPFSSRTIELRFSPAYFGEEQELDIRPSSVLVYRLEPASEASYVPCGEIAASPDWTIPVADAARE